MKNIFETHTEKRINSFEKSQSFNKIMDVIKMYKNNKIDYDQLNAYTEEFFKKSGNESYDCHSFILSVLKNKFNVDVTTIQGIEKPLRNNYKLSVDWIEEYSKKVKKYYILMMQMNIEIN